MTISALSAANTACEESRWTLSNLSLQKLLYIAHMTHLGRHQEPLIRESFEAWDYGPVVPSLYQTAKIFGDQAIQRLPAVERNFSLLDHQTVRDVVSRFSDLSPGQLVDLTHRRDGAWYRHYDPGMRRIKIPNTDILDEYRVRTIAA